MNLADSLNLGCLCRTLSPQNLRAQLESDPSLAGLTERLASSHPHLFSPTSVFLDAATRDLLARTVAAIERVIALPACQAYTLAQAPAIARHTFGPAGIFMGYDFHMAAGWPRLIEINTNAGGALLNAALREACEAGAVVLTPHPRAQALFADKRHLVTQGDAALLAAWGVTDDDRRLLHAAIPRTTQVTPHNADALWAKRRHLFFKPTTGFGSRAAYRGDKLTRRVWKHIMAGDAVAQALVPPSERLVDVNGEPTRLELDLRACTDRGAVQLLAARTRSGQITNIRTPGGGFSPAVVLPAAEATAPQTVAHGARQRAIALRSLAPSP